MRATAPLAGAAAEAETVDAYRRYPQPEILQLAIRPRESPAPPFASTSPVELVAPRSRSPAGSLSCSASPAPPSDFTEAIPGGHVRGDDTGDGQAACREGSEEAERNENKAGDYKAKPSTVSPTSTANAAAVAATPPDPQRIQEQTVPAAFHIPVQLRWGFDAADLRRVYEMHEDAFPLSYGPEYYEWLLDHDACMALVATVTIETYTRWAGTAVTEENREDGEVVLSDDVPLSWLPDCSSSSADGVAGPTAMPPPASKRPLTAEMIHERAQVDCALTELEYMAQCKRGDQAEVTEWAQNAGSVSRNDHGTSSAYTEIIGFILGQCAYALHDAGHLFTNPTSYIGSFVVDPRFQRCGLGSALLQRFLVYVTRQRPLYAQDYLHYDERKLIAMLVETQLKKRSKHWDASSAESRGGGGSCGNDNGSSCKKDDDVATPPITATTATASCTAASSTTSGSAAPSSAPTPSLSYHLACTYFPEALTWWEDRQARRQLRERGLSKEEIDVLRFRDRLSPDALTDEEADEVRRDARRLLVQTGMREVWLHCLPGNVKAMQLYAHCGFLLHRVIKDYYDVDEKKYDANLLRYSSPAVETVVSGDGVSGGAANHLDIAPAAAVDVEMDAVVQQYDSQTQMKLNSTTSALTSTAVASTGMPSLVTSVGVLGEGLRRRHTSRRTGGSTEVAATSSNDGLPVSCTESTSDVARSTANCSVSLATPAGTADHGAGAMPNPSAATPRSPAAPAAVQPSDTRRSLARASWLSPRTYPVVADIVLCTAAKGREVWQRRFGEPDDGVGRGSWWETAREVVFSVNAIGVLCAVLWLAYNVCLTGKVE
ncbi:hypothetical protein ABL78_5469 [Leptomonas seymouri]|uniref:N-alpha-acetyltransferase 60 n=1 Tax=Leptomonas seymouri TaxID=5684 RepID=A0A0N0P4M7_LEPSE|nr:hypothetical protein ABL78_5469 [Leptomonas seymouri]|eukprot:KPI85476.1 hypothetical protein ABL78_5469 [Leptomonas seymouri]